MPTISISMRGPRSAFVFVAVALGMVACGGQGAEAVEGSDGVDEAIVAETRIAASRPGGDLSCPWPGEVACPHCGHLLWFSDDITARHPDLAAKWSQAKEGVLKTVANHLGPPPEHVRLALEGLSPDKFDKVKEFLVQLMQINSLKTWDDVVVTIQAVNR